MDNDTIAAVATAAGRGSIGVVRISGPLAEPIGREISGQTLHPRYAHYTDLNANGQCIDRGIALYFPAPNSFTGEAIVEFQAHGGPVVLDLILKDCIRLGARQASPGEFSQRAYLNGKMDLAQAEAIADLINSSTEQAARNASRTLQGEFSSQITSLASEIKNLRILVEAAIDFPEEEIDFIEQSEVKEQLKTIITTFEKVQHQARQGSLISEGMKLVIVGKPNAGKSSLLNTLAGQDVAIVTAIEGTTRDVLRDQIQLDGIPIHIVDTAGLRESPDEIEQEGIRRARREMHSADHLLWVQDLTQENLSSSLSAPDAALIDNIPTTVVANKCDALNREPGKTIIDGITKITLSAKTGNGIELLKNHLKESMGFDESQEGVFSARRRHLEALNEVGRHLQTGLLALEEQSAAELLAEDLRQAQQALGEITGSYSSDELLGDIFSSFCIGK